MILEMMLQARFPWRRVAMWATQIVSYQEKTRMQVSFCALFAEEK
jgi:hypothetical protein